MPVRIRLQRRGRKKKAFYYIVAADSHAPRDGRFIEKLGTYNPVTNPATIELNRDSTLEWLQKGAQPSDTAKKILSYKGVLYKKHLLRGVKLGIFDEKVADEKFDKWLEKHEGDELAAKKKLVEAKQKAQQEAEAEARKIREEKEAKAKAEKEAAEAEAQKKAEEEAAAAEAEANQEDKTEEGKAEEDKAEAKAPEAETPDTTEDAKEEKSEDKETK